MGMHGGQADQDGTEVPKATERVAAAVTKRPRGPSFGSPALCPNVSKGGMSGGGMWGAGWGDVQGVGYLGRGNRVSGGVTSGRG